MWEMGRRWGDCNNSVDNSSSCGDRHRPCTGGAGREGGGLKKRGGEAGDGWWRGWAERMVWEGE